MKNVFHLNNFIYAFILVIAISLFLNIGITIIEFIIVNDSLPLNYTFWLKYPVLLGLLMGGISFIIGVIFYFVLKSDLLYISPFVSIVTILAIYLNRLVFSGETSFIKIIGFNNITTIIHIFINAIILSISLIIGWLLCKTLKCSLKRVCLVSIVIIVVSVIIIRVQEHNKHVSSSKEYAYKIHNGSGTSYPNIFIFSIDTLRADYVGCYGNNETKTPFIDALSKKSILFSECYATSPWTRPSFASLFSSTYPYKNGTIRKNFCFSREQDQEFLAYDYPLNKEIPWLPEILSGVGYLTACFQSNLFMTPKYGFDRGFKTFIIADYLRPHIPLACHMMEYLGVSLDELKTYYLIRYDSENLTSSFLDWLNGNLRLNKPLFAWINYMEVHEPHVDPRTPRNKIGQALQYFEETRQNPRVKEFLISQYQSEILFTDKLIGRLINKLREYKVYNDSIIVFLSDHGQELYDNPDPKIDSLYAKPLAFGHGYSMSDEVIKAPLLIKYPRCYPKQVDTVCSLLDFMPTILKLIKVGNHADSKTFMQGSILPGLQKVSNYNQRYVFCESTNVGSERKCIISKEFKLEWFGPPIGVEYKVPSGFYLWRGNNQSDQEIRRLLSQFVNRSNAEQARFMNRSNSVTLNSETIEAFKALGYLK